MKEWKLSQETRAKMRAAKLGTKLSKQTKAKISAAQRKYQERVRKLLSRAEHSDAGRAA